jgi:hypothetical protein
MTIRKKTIKKDSDATRDAKAVETQEKDGKSIEAQVTVENAAAGFPVVGIGSLFAQPARNQA